MIKLSELKNPKNFWYYLQGYYRKICHDNFPFLLRSSVIAKVESRIRVAKACLQNTECLACGCDTPAVFYANKSCKAPIYLERPPCYIEMDEIKRKALKVLRKVTRKNPDKYCNIKNIHPFDENSVKKWYYKHYNTKYLIFNNLHKEYKLFGNLPYKFVIGNYGKSPIGIHNDPDTVITEIVLEGSKNYLEYDKVTEEMIFSDDKYYAPDYFTQLKEGEIYHFDGNRFHSTFSDKFSFVIIVYSKLGKVESDVE